MKLMIQHTTIFAAVTGLLTACGGGTTIEHHSAEVEEEPTSSYDEPLATSDAPAPQKTPAAPKIDVVAMARTPLENKKAPSLRFVQPRKNSVAKKDIMVKFDLKNWKVGPEPGKHVHLFVDDKPYIAIRDVAKPINLNKLYQETFGEELAEGTHILRAFPSRATHESVKEGKPFAFVVVHNKSKTDGFEFDPKAPMLVYSRPKGCVAAGQPTLLDFYLVNVDKLAGSSNADADGDAEEDEDAEENGDAEGYTVDVLVDQKKVATISEWAPHQLSGLTEGPHTIELMLASNGEPVQTTLQAEQTIEVKSKCEKPAPAPEATEGAPGQDKKAKKGSSAQANPSANAPGKAGKADKADKADTADNKAAPGAGGAAKDKANK